MEEMDVRVMENEEPEDIAEVEEAEESGSIGALVTGVVGGFLAYTMIGGIRRLWGLVGAKLTERKATKKAKAEVVGAGYTEIAAESSDEEGSER